jgi:uncharacterized protein (DUF111 family)
MKKGRPAQQVSALVGAAELSAVQQAFFLHSTTLGLRVQPVSRLTLPRAVERVSTPFGPIAIKVAGLNGEAIGAQPEYDDCRRAAAAAGVPVRRVWTAALAAGAALGAISRADVASAGQRRGPRRGGRKIATVGRPRRRRA